MSDDALARRLDGIERQLAEIRRNQNDIDALLGRTIVATTAIAQAVLRTGDVLAGSVPSTDGRLGIAVRLDMVQQQIALLKQAVEAVEDGVGHE